MNAHELQQRLIDFGVQIIRIAESLPSTKAGSCLSGQLVRSGTSPALNYGEAQSAESRADFIHKLKVVLKELRETSISLQLAQSALSLATPRLLEQAMLECDELISIFVKSVKTAEANRCRGQRR